ncbi:hypothetical protein GBAR_LOCUS10130 [Geodia barretti]|uniref:Uncharacterized protein n=1 Tax=Geodia barretti TaxID=519541 RepID=A0AA35RTE8_GEOBA|nr:hypothetical protein GBAR_LOCUS10130 [Geodia barretti]
MYFTLVLKSVKMCVCLVWVKKRKEGESCGERGVVTETRGGLVGVIKAPDHQTYTQAVHGVTNRSVLPHAIWCMFYITVVTNPQT